MVGSHSCINLTISAFYLGGCLDHFYSVTSPEMVGLKDAFLVFPVFCSLSLLSSHSPSAY